MQKLPVLLLLGTTVLSLPIFAGVRHDMQNSKEAIKFFESKLDFETNPYGVKTIIEGEAKNFTIVDVRLAKDFAEGHIPGAINIPADEHQWFTGSSDKTFPQLRKDGYNYIYCYKHLCNLAQKAAKKFASLGHPVKEMVGGFRSWKEEGYPVEK